MKIKTILVLALLPLVAQAEKTLSVYFIGNSLTMSTTLDRVHGFFAQRDIDLQFGSQVSGGKSLIRHLNYKSEPKQKWGSWETNVAKDDTYLPSDNFYMDKVFRFGRFDHALPNFNWDKVVMQLYGSNLHDDMTAIPAFIDLALSHDADEEFYIYSVWPNRKIAIGPDKKPTDKIVNLDYPGEWNSPYTATIDQTDWQAGKSYYSRDYVKQLHHLLEEKYPDLKHPIRVIPTGEVFYAIDLKIKAGELPGIEQLAERQPEMLPGLDDDTGFADGANVLYADKHHLNPIPHQVGTLGIFISGTTLFTVLSGQNPVGLSAESYGLDDEKDAPLIRAIQQTIWDVVTTDPLTGVSK